MIRIPTFPATDPVASEADAPPPDPALAESAHYRAQNEARRADVAFRQTAEDILRGGDQPFLALPGDQAVAAAGPVSERLGKAFEQTAAGLSRHAREKFAAVAEPDLTNRRQEVASYAARQEAAANTAASIARQNDAKTNFARRAADDPAQAATSLNVVTGEAYGRAMRQNPEDPAGAQLAARLAGSDATAAAVQFHLDSDPHVALGLFERCLPMLDDHTAAVLGPVVSGEAARAARSHRIDEVIAANRPPPPQGLDGVLPADFNPPLDPDIVSAQVREGWTRPSTRPPTCRPRPASPRSTRSAPPPAGPRSPAPAASWPTRRSARWTTCRPAFALSCRPPPAGGSKSSMPPMVTRRSATR